MKIINCLIVLFFLTSFTLGCVAFGRKKQAAYVLNNVKQFWLARECVGNSQKWQIDELLEEPPIGVSSSFVVDRLGSPLHWRSMNSGEFIYFYYYYGTSNPDDCPWSELICFRFSNNGKLQGIFIYFILDYEESAFFWHSEGLPDRSFEGDGFDEFYPPRRIVHKK